MILELSVPQCLEWTSDSLLMSHLINKTIVAHVKTKTELNTWAQPADVGV